MAPRICASSTSVAPTPFEDSIEAPEWLGMPAIGAFKVWQVVSAGTAAFAMMVILICCCVRFRIPRTKEEIEADYVRKRIARKFRRHLRLIQNADMDEMDLKRALDRVRAEFKSDTESVAQSEALSVAESISSTRTATYYRKASDLLAGMTIDDIPTQRTLGTRFADLVDAALVTLRLRKRTPLVHNNTPEHQLADIA